MKKLQTDIMNQEFLLTNGLGGYAFGTLDDANSRKYHGLYTVSLEPPVKRRHLISKLVPELHFENRSIQWSFEHSPSKDETETTFVAYEHQGPVVQTFKKEQVTMKRTMAFLHGTHALAVVYDVEVNEPCVLRISPYFNFRDHHDVSMPNLEAYECHSKDCLEVNCEGLSVYLKTSGTFLENRHMSPLSHYPIETQRGYPDQEAHVVLGAFHYPLKAGINTIELVINLLPEFPDASEIIAHSKKRYRMLVEKAGAKTERTQRLVQAADDFIVHRKNTGKKTIIAGYPWFTDWGRDTMIALPGLTLSTGRYDEALQMIEGFLSKAYRGIIPNNFPDENEAPMYNTCDGTLWLFNAVFAYYKATADKVAIKKLLPDLVSIIKHHMEGTINDIYMDADGLLSAGNETTQLTWMDVKVEGWVVTPRHGKAVEINALWYNALCVTDYLAAEVSAGAPVGRLHLSSLAMKVKKSFNDHFWIEAGEESRLADLIIDGEIYDIPRPNMIFAVSLPFPVLDAERWPSVVRYVQRHFKVPYGLLTLKSNDPDFKGTYGGSLLSRDGAYHRGTAWGWLIGPYFDALLKTFSDQAMVKKDLELFSKHLEEGVIGSVSEIFEGNAPHAQRGCPAQAWSVAEILRIALKLED